MSFRSTAHLLGVLLVFNGILGAKGSMKDPPNGASSIALILKTVATTTSSHDKSTNAQGSTVTFTSSPTTVVSSLSSSDSDTTTTLQPPPLVTSPPPVPIGPSTVEPTSVTNDVTATSPLPPDVNNIQQSATTNQPTGHEMSIISTSSLAGPSHVVTTTTTPLVVTVSTAHVQTTPSNTDRFTSAVLINTDQLNTASPATDTEASTPADEVTSPSDVTAETSPAFSASAKPGSFTTSFSANNTNHYAPIQPTTSLLANEVVPSSTPIPPQSVTSSGIDAMDSSVTAAAGRNTDRLGGGTRGVNSIPEMTSQTAAIGGFSSAPASVQFQRSTVTQFPAARSPDSTVGEATTPGSLFHPTSIEAGDDASQQPPAATAVVTPKLPVSEVVVVTSSPPAVTPRADLMTTLIASDGKESTKIASPDHYFSAVTTSSVTHSETVTSLDTMLTPDYSSVQDTPTTNDMMSSHGVEVSSAETTASHIAITRSIEDSSSGDLDTDAGQGFLSTESISNDLEKLSKSSAMLSTEASITPSLRNANTTVTSNSTAITPTTEQINSSASLNHSAASTAITTDGPMNKINATGTPSKVSDATSTAMDLSLTSAAPTKEDVEEDGTTNADTANTVTSKPAEVSSPQPLTKGPIDVTSVTSTAVSTVDATFGSTQSPGDGGPRPTTPSSPKATPTKSTVKLETRSPTPAVAAQGSDNHKIIIGLVITVIVCLVIALVLGTLYCKLKKRRSNYNLLEEGGGANGVRFENPLYNKMFQDPSVVTKHSGDTSLLS